MAPVLEKLLGTTSCAEFFDRHFAAEPLLAKGAARWAVELATRAVCERLIAEPRVDVMLARMGARYTGLRPDATEAARLFAEGFTWVLRDVDRADPALADFGRSLASDVHGSLHLQLYRTPPSTTGFGWHFDPEEVFYVQTHGRKRLRLRENTQHPWPLPDAFSTQLKAEAEATPILEHLLEPGDALYIP